MNYRKYMKVLLCGLLLSGCSKNGASPSVSAKEQKEKETILEDVIEATPAPADTLDGMHQSMKDADCILGTLFFGFSDSWDYASAMSMLEDNIFSDSFPFLKEIEEDHFVNAGGYMLYLVVPEMDADLTIYSIDENQEHTEELYKNNDGKPVLLVCNEMDEADIEVNVTNTTDSVVFYPLVGDDFRSVLLPDHGVLDFSSTAYYSEAGMQDSLDYMREELRMEESLLGASFLGYVEKASSADIKALLESNYMGMFYPFIYNVDTANYIDAGGYEVYLLVPVSDDTTIAINKIDADNNVLEVLHRDEYGNPVILVCNEDETPNTVVEVTEGDRTVTFYPMLNQANGSLYLPNGGGVSDYSYSSGANEDAFFLQACFDTLYYEVDEVQQAVAEGKTIEYFDETAVIEDTDCIVFELGTYEGEAFKSEKKYAVTTDSMIVYRLEENGSYTQIYNKYQ